MEVPTAVLNRIIGENNVTINRIRMDSGARVEINKFPMPGCSTVNCVNVFGHPNKIILATRQVGYCRFVFTQYCLENVSLKQMFMLEKRGRKRRLVFASNR